MSLADSGQQERIEEFLRKSLLGEELVNTQFHLFSARSTPSSRLTNPRVLCANNVLLAKSSKYFLDLLSSDVNPSDGSLSDLTDTNDVPSHIRIDDYGYGSDSDFGEDDEESPVPVTDTEVTTVSKASLQISITTQPKDDEELSEDGSESVSSDMFVMSPEHPTLRMDESLPEITSVGEDGSVMSGKTAVQESSGNKTLASCTAAVRLRSLGSRHILVKDTAFRTWYSLLNYLYTDKVYFLPLESATAEGHPSPQESSASHLDKPRCSAKSMYRLACKVGLDHLRDEALAHIRGNLSEHNILKELSSSLLSKHPELLEMELDVLFAQIASPPVVTGLPALARRIAHKELPHGADIIVGIHTRLVNKCHPLPSTPMPSVPPSLSSPSSLPPPRDIVSPDPPPPITGAPSPTIKGELPKPVSTGFGQWGAGSLWGDMIKSKPAEPTPTPFRPWGVGSVRNDTTEIKPTEPAPTSSDQYSGECGLEGPELQQSTQGKMGKRKKK